jgi:hypothetical protein
MNLENLFSNLLDESRRQSSIDDKSSTKVLYAKGPRKPLKDRVTKTQQKKYCNKCKTTQHSTSACWYLNPDKKTKWFKTGSDYDKPAGYKEDPSRRQDDSPKDTTLLNYEDLDIADEAEWNYSSLLGMI